MNFQFLLTHVTHVFSMEIERVTDLAREEEKLLALLAQEGDFTEEQIDALKEQLPEIEKAISNLRITDEKYAILEQSKKNLVEVEAMILAQPCCAAKDQVLQNGQSPLEMEEFQRLLRFFPSLLPSPFLPENKKYFGYKTMTNYFLRVSSSGGELLFEIDIEKEFLL